MNENELSIKHELIKLVSLYDETTSEEKKLVLYNKIAELANNNLDNDYLDNYYCSCSIEEFCTQLSIEIIQPNNHNKTEILNFIHTIFQHRNNIDSFDYYIEKFSLAIEYFYKKPQGTLREYIYHDDIDTIDAIINKLNEDTTIYL